jgi:3-oxoadipate enol-lactonase
VKLHHRIDGVGERVVVLSGSLGSTLEMWDPQVAALTDRFRLLRYDHPGHGGSPLADVDSVSALARLVVELLDELRLERVSFCGLSLGGSVGIQLALNAPHRVHRLVVSSTAPRFATPDFWEERAAIVRASGVEAIAELLLERWFTPDFGEVQRFRDMLLSMSAEGYARCCDALRDWDARGRLGTIRAPTTAIAGSDDPTAPPEQVEAIVAEIPAARLIVIERARHLVSVERSEEFNEALIEHLG